MDNQNVCEITLSIPMGDGTKVQSVITAKPDETFDTVMSRQPEAIHFLLALRRNFPKDTAHLNGKSEFGEMLETFTHLALDAGKEKARKAEVEGLNRQFNSL